MSESLPQIVYKYRNWKDKYHKDVLYKNHLFLSSPKDFNDPFDCRIPKNYKLLDTEEKVDEYINKFIKEAYERIISDGRDIHKEQEKIKHRLMNESDKLQSEYEEAYFKSQDIYYGILSLSERWDSILMWSHYADNHRGYCVGFWENELSNSNKFGTGGPVSYDPDDDYPQIDPRDEFSMESAFKETHSKAYDWKYEKEYRLTKLFYPNIPEIQDRIVEVPDNYFSEIIIGLKTPKEEKKEIIELAKQKNIRVYEIYKVPFKFQLARQEIK